MRYVVAYALLLMACGVKKPQPGIEITAQIVPPAAPTTAALEQAIQTRSAQLDSGEVAVSVIDLATGRELHVNGDLSMHAASTMKVPVLLEVFNRGPAFLDSAIVIYNRFRSIADTSHYTLDPADDSELELYEKIGQPLTVRELARLMIVRSSNLATNILIDVLTAARIRVAVAEADGSGMNVLRGVEDGAAFRRGMNNTTTSRGFANVLAAIARCKTHTRAACEEMQGILSGQEFNDMIPAGLPSGTRVAHKTGWITRVQHDGGIVLPPNRPPYVLVILTRGIADTLVADQVGADISRIVWEHLTDSRWQSIGSAHDSLYERFRVVDLTTRVFNHPAYWPVLERYAGGPLEREQIGASAEGRPLYLIRYGTGPVRVLLWSQMHGDESTATLALADLMGYLHEGRDARTQEWARKLTILLVPMLNPDGAETFTRHNALGIDVNRDARRLATPEARALKAVRDRYEPQFGFNLHDQNAKTRIGDTGRLAAIALLAPPTDSARQETPSVRRAKQVAAVIRNAIEPYVPGHIAKYDDSFNPRAFGDLMQRWGTSTVLIESGGWKDDPEKQYLRRVNFVAFVAALDAIASGEYERTDVAAYNSLLMNGPPVLDLVVRGGTVVFPGGMPYRADIGIDFAEMRGQRTSGRVVEIGDLEHVQARDTIDATGLFIHPATRMHTRVGRDTPHYRLAAGASPAFTLTRDPAGLTAAVFSVEGTAWRKIGAEAKPQGAPHSAVGCYAVERGNWSAGDRDNTAAQLPAEVRLLWVYGTQQFERNQLLVRPIDGGGLTAPTAPRFMFWRADDETRITIMLTSGFSGAGIELTRDGELWKGSATSFTDEDYAGKVDPTAPVTLRRIACD